MYGIFHHEVGDVAGDPSSLKSNNFLHMLSRRNWAHFGPHSYVMYEDSPMLYLSKTKIIAL